MELTKVAVVVLVLVARTCRSEIVIATPSRDESAPSLVDDLAKMVASCYGDRTQVGLIGHVRDDLARTLSARYFIPVVLMDSSPSYTLSWKTLFAHKLNVFIADAISVEKFKFVMEYRLQASIWWNPMASVFILDRSPGCYRAVNYLREAWIGDLLSAKILCDDPNCGRVIITFNPFTSKAPTPWRNFKVFTGYRGHPFTMLYREYRMNGKICANLDFDKTTDFGGYPIIVYGRPLGTEVRHYTNLSQKRYWREQDRIFDTLSRTLNISMFFSEAIEVYDIVKEDSVFGYNWRFSETTYPFKNVGLVIISQFRGHKSQLSKILSVIDIDSQIGLGIVYLITLIFLKFFVRQALVPALLNLVRITCNTGFSNLPDNTASRIYMTSLLFVAVTIQGIYQGNWAALLTQQISLRPIETIQDIVDFDYKVYSSYFENVLPDHPNLDERLRTVSNPDDCVALVADDSLAACVAFAEASELDRARKFNLHISSEPVKLMYVAHLTRTNWPLQTKFEVIIRKLVEGDLLEPWNDKCNPTKWSDFQIDAEVRKNTDFKKIELGELAFSFVILGIGLLCATFVFIIELAIQYKCIFVDRRIIN